MEERNTKDNHRKEEQEKSGADERSIRERAYDWLYNHHVTVKVMDYIIAVLVILAVAVIIGGMLVGK
ncbi:MAG: hypothetical protein Q4E89_01760 [Eubacteriales bacterium]|nr:hypothetical protein [Eubacteriales bacterium]